MSTHRTSGHSHNLIMPRVRSAFSLLVATLLALSISGSAMAGKAFETDQVSGRQLIEYLEHPDWRFRYDATRELADRRIEQAKAPIEDLAANDSNDRVRRAALNVLMDVFGGPSERSVLHEILLESNDPDLRYHVVRKIESSPRAEDRGALISALDDSDPNVARHAARALVRVGDRNVASVLRDKAMDVTDRNVAEEFNVAATRLGG